MSSNKKKDLEIIYNLQWKNKPANGGDKANIIGMYDIPATTLNWEVFKSYLLKNSGTVGDDVKVSYITDSNREFAIDSQVDFQIALYAFRRKARLGEIVNLKLDRISGLPTHKNIRHSNDVETQFDNNEAVSLTSTCCNVESAPEWFISYMGQFKKNITEDLATTVSNLVTNVKPHAVNVTSSYHIRKSKADCTKRIRKPAPLLGESSYETKDLKKAHRTEGKYERKLEKLEHKTKKINKKLALFATKYSESDVVQNSERNASSRHCEREDDAFEMDATPVNTQAAVPHMLGGEIYLHQWEVKNTGKQPWTSKTSLNFTWGSKALKPLDTIISVPYLKPGETGTLAVRLQIPNYPGEYECYFHFHHKERRFGHWLGCVVVVDPFDLKGNKSVLSKSGGVSEYSPAKFQGCSKETYNIDEPVTQYIEIVSDPVTSTTRTFPYNIAENCVRKCDSGEENQQLDEFLRKISCANDVKLQDPTDTNCSSDSDNQSIVSVTESNSSKNSPEDFVVVPIPDCFKIDHSPRPSEEIVSSAPPKENNDLATDSSASICVALDKMELNKEAGASVEQAPENYDDNNNTEEADQNSAVGNGVGGLEDDKTDSSRGSQSSDMVVVTLPENVEDEGYAYVLVDGQKLPIPKMILKPQYLRSVEEGPEKPRVRIASAQVSTRFVKGTLFELEECVNPQDDTTKTPANESGFASVPDQTMADSNADFFSHCSAAGSSFSDANAEAENNARLFIFPHDCPGYEVIYPVLDVPQPEVVPGEYKWSESGTHYAFSSSTPVTTSYPMFPVPSAPEPFVATTTNSPPLNLSTHDRNPFSPSATPHVPNYQQTSPAMRASPPGTSPLAPSMPTPEVSHAPLFLTLRTDTPVTSVETPVVAAKVTISSAETPTTAAGTPVVEATVTSGDVHVTSGTNTPIVAGPNARPVHILPETLVSGAVNVASSAISTARSVINMIVPQPMPMPPNNDVLQQPGRWVNGHWVSTNPETPREANLQALAEMGFWNRDLNATLLARYNDDLSRVVAELVQ